MNFNRIKIASGPLMAMLIFFFTDLEPGKPEVTAMAAVAVWMAVWWLTEAVHLAVTALIPIMMLPLLGIASAKDVSAQYMDQVIFLFIGGFLISFAFERWTLHERIALKILSVAGSKPQNILAGLMVTAFVISMWISNTATVMMMLSAVLAIVHMTDTAVNKGFHKSILIGLAYAATIGGMATLVGTPPNMVFYKMYTESYPNGQPVTFTTWFAFAFPIALIMLVICYFVLRLLFLRKAETSGLTKEYFRARYKELGKVTYEQRCVATVFFITALLWFTRADLNLGGLQLKGWSHLFNQAAWITDSTIAMTMAFILFLIPSKEKKEEALLTWKEAAKLPFDIILLFGSGFALSMGFEKSGLSNWLAGHMSVLQHAPSWVLVLAIVSLLCIISEFASNVASIQLMLPVLIPLQHELQIEPLLILVPATLAASLGFMLPVATAPNTIVFGSRRILVGDMAKAGLVMDIAGIITLTIIMWLML